MAKPNNNKIFTKAVAVAVLGAASLSATEWQYSAPSLFEVAGFSQSSSLDMWSGQPSVSMSAASSSNSGWGAAGSIGPSASAWGEQTSTVYSDDVFRNYLYSGSSPDMTSGNGSFSSAWSTYNSNTSSAAAWGGASSTSSGAWGGSTTNDPWGGGSNNGAWYTASGSSGAWGAWGGSSSNPSWTSGSDTAACTAVSSWAASTPAVSSSAPVWGGSYSAPSVAAPVSTCTSTIGNLAPTTPLESTGSGELLGSTPDLEVIDSPEPSTWVLLLTGVGLAGWSRRKRSV
ncbi:MAG: PEP-CTERM sorting domain-containing protein [Bryobacterales bacterium]|nr:PEP-CTERM sorting domain-containing protein [Bryobacterales bacterium]